MQAPRFIQLGSLVFAAITTFAAVAVADPPSFARKWGEAGQADGQLSTPHGLCVDAAGDVYVADFGNHRVQKHSSMGAFLGAFGGPGNNPGRFQNPRDIAVDASGTLYVADDRGIQVFDPAFAYQREWSTGSTVADHIAVSPSGDRVYIGSGAWIVIYDRDGNFLDSWQYASPVGAGRGALAVGPSGAVYVTLTGANRVRKFSADGDLVAEWGDLGSGPGKFVGPKAIAVDADEKVYVGDGYSRLQKFSASGGFLDAWGAFGSGDGEFLDISDIAIDASANIYVLDRELDRVQVFEGGMVPVLQTTWGALKQRYR